MAATGTPTTNIGLRRPQGTDPASVDDINYNSEVIDTKMGAVGETSLQAQVTALNSKLTQISKITISGTLSSGGSISTGLQNKAILGVVIPHGSALFTGCVSYSSGGVPWITVYDIRTMNPVGAEQVSIDVYYCDFK